MSSPNLSNSGRQLLNRRGFLGDAAMGLSSIALLDLLADDRLLAGDGVVPAAKHRHLLARLPAHLF